MLEYGSKNYTDSDIADLIDFSGSKLSTYRGFHGTGIVSTVLKEHQEKIMDLLNDIIANPTFPEKHISILENRINTTIKMLYESSPSLCAVRLKETIYENHPYGKSLLGDEHGVSFSAEDLATFHNKYYNPSSSSIVVTGDFDKDKLIECFSDWRKSASQIETTDIKQVKLADSKTVREKLPGKTQSEISISFPLTKRNTTDYFKILLLTFIFGSSDLGGRLGQAIREKAGLAYHCNGVAIMKKHSGTYLIRAGVNPSNVSRAIDLITKELTKFGEKGITEQEFKFAKSCLINLLPIAIQNNEQIASIFKKMILYNLESSYVQDYASNIKKLTLDEVNACARKYFSPSNLVTVVVEPQ